MLQFFNKLIFITPLFLFSIILFSQEKAKVVGIKDGDTIVVLLENNITETLRLAEIDSPEKSQAFGKNAKQFTSTAVYGSTVFFFRQETDQYGRIIAKVYYGKNKYLSAELVKAGFAWVYKKYSNNKNLIESEKDAQIKKLGLWVDKNPTPPWVFRHKKV